MENRVEATTAPDNDLEPRFSLVSGEGDGFLLGLAAGDAAGGAWELGYSAVTEQATILAYDLIQHRQVDAERLVASLIELDGSNDEDVVYRAETPSYRRWLDGATRGAPVPSSRPGLDGAARSTVVGVAFRNDPAVVVSETVSLARIFDRDASSVALSVIAATAAAASCFAQSGADLVAGVAEAVAPALVEIADEFDSGDRIDDLGARLEGLIHQVGVIEAEPALDVVGGDSDDPLSAVLAALLLAAPVNDRFHSAVEQSARIGGSALGGFAGAIIGARLGIKGWPWAFANDTWFAEIGRRLVRGPDQVEDLPIPYAVEHHLMYGPGRGFR